LREIAREALHRNMPLCFVLIGQTNPGLPAGEPFEQTGPYNNDDLPQLLKRSGAQAVWFPAQWPETFSYTLSACLETGTPVIAPNLGAFAERLAGRGWSWVVPWDWDNHRMLEFFLSLRRDHFLTSEPPEIPNHEGPRAVADFYPDSYLG
jgi:glycosyltransferase involved in cell wall biosynthesis